MKKLMGQIVGEHHQKGHKLEDDIIEYRRLMEKELMQMIQDCVNNALKKDVYTNKNFYVVLVQTVESIMQAARNITLARLSCPTPVYKQSVWKYHYKSGDLEYLWSLPDKHIYWDIIKRSKEYLYNKEYAELAKFCILNESGELLNWVKKENGEKKDAVIFTDGRHLKEPECLITNK